MQGTNISVATMERICIIKLTNLLKDMPGFMGVQVDSFYEISQSRKKRYLQRQDKIGTNYTVSFEQKGETVKDYMEKQQTSSGLVCKTNGDLCLDINQTSFNSADVPCRKKNNNCDAGTTTCSPEGGIPQCKCRDGFTKLETSDDRCQDIDECSVEDRCIGGHCVNTPGGWGCGCPEGYSEQKISDDSHKCKDLCEDKPCKNGGECKHQQGYNSYICSCPDGYQGHQCEIEDPKAESFRIILIAVGSVLGGLCLLLLVSLLGVCRRNMARHEKSSSSDTNDSHNRWSGAIPRPKIINDRDHLEMIEHPTSARLGDNDQYEDVERPMLSQEKHIRNGTDNPAYAHIKAKNSYEYF